MARELKPIPQEALREIRDFNSFVWFLRNELDWPVPEDRQLTPEDLTYEYLASELQLKSEHADRLKIRQLVPFYSGQPWGIFLLEFSTSKFYRSLFRQVMRALAPRRQHDPGLPNWKPQHLLFICTNDYQQFTFGHFSGDKPTGARLTTFTLDPDSSKWRTLCEFNLKALRWPAERDVQPDPAAWLAQWKQAFDKEELTNRFFRIFRTQFVELARDIRANNADISEQDANTEAQVLLERMLFLYFLQRKGWLSQQPKYLYEKFQEIQDKNPTGFTYYSTFLSRVFQQLSAHDEIYTESIGHVPFLNGGLFEDDPVVYSEETQRRLRLKVSNGVFRGIFEEMLERFNFTVREDTPLNQDVSIDPEMLGKILESLVLEMEEAGDAYAPDRRKATGSYYTPRIVVHFICREVLRQYLLARLEGSDWRGRIERLLSIEATVGLDDGELLALRSIFSQEEAARIRGLLLEIKACDPAIGSGAFAVGLLHELVNLWTLCEGREREKDPTQDRNYLFEIKRKFIENAIYGADLLDRAVEICKLRLWLSLIVDYELWVNAFDCTKEQFAAALRELPPLPNLAFKIRRGDALLDQIRGQELILEEFVKREGRGSREGQDLVDQIVKRKDDFFKENDVQVKRRLQIQVLELQWELAERFIAQQRESLPALQAEWSFGESKKQAELRRWREQQEERLETAKKEIASLREKLEVIKKRKTIADAQARRLAELEGQVGPKYSFVWHLDFAEVFNRKTRTTATLRGKFAFVNQAPGQTELAESRPYPRGFDIIVGNPPFVTARNAERREGYRKRWPLVCYQKYHLLAPFFERSFGLLAPDGELGFIVSNAFAKREFGKPLVEEFFPRVNLRKIVDCSGLMFPGHGTPTCIVFGSNRRPEPGTTVRNVATLPGGGDLCTPPEESPLWHGIEAYHSLASSAAENAPLSQAEAEQGFRKVHEDFRIAVADCDRSRMLSHPCVWGFFDWSVFDRLVNAGSAKLRTYLGDDVGFMFVMGCNEVFIQSIDTARRLGLSAEYLLKLYEGEEVRNWNLDGQHLGIFPYDRKTIELLRFPSKSAEMEFLASFKRPLSERPTFSGSFEEAGRIFYQYHQLPIERAKNPRSIVFSEIATHGHFVYLDGLRLFTQTAPVVKLQAKASDEDHDLICSLLNSSAGLFWLKQVCFNKGAGEDEERDRFVYAGNKVQQLPVPPSSADALNGKSNDLANRVTLLSQTCRERGHRMPALALRNLFETPGEAYHDCNRQLSGSVMLNAQLGAAFDSANALRRAYDKLQSMRDRLRAEMIALQEEMDWLVYAAYGLLPEDHPAAQVELEPESLEREQRPFMMWAKAEGKHDKAVNLIPAGWPATRKRLWEARLAVIRDNEHIRRIEQPVYKRRWDEQWKVGNQWRCGPIAYAAEFAEAFEWWLREKAEWWLEHKRNGGPVDLNAWTDALWRDSRVKAAWPVAAEQYAFLEAEKAREKAEENGEATPPSAKPKTDAASFCREFKRIIEDETVPAGFPFAVPYEDLEKKLKKKVPAKLRSIRGKLNVPRERFHRQDDGMYSWAGLQFK